MILRKFKVKIKKFEQNIFGKKPKHFLMYKENT
jgi:hypothetical protein